MHQQNDNLSLTSLGCKRPWFRLWVFGVLVLASALFFGLRPAYSNENSTQATIVRGLQAIDKNRWETGRKLMAGTDDPLAAKLYFWLYFQNDNHNDADFVKMVQFVRANPDWPGTWTLRLKAERNMPGNLSSADVIGWFDDYPPQTAPGLMMYLDALLVSGRKDQARALVSEWWSGKTLSRDDQKRIYYKYKNYLTLESHHKRFDNLLFAKQYTNARAVAQVLGNGYPELAEARIALAEKKGNVNGLIAKVPAHLKNDPGILYERLRWRRRNDYNDGAVEILKIEPEASRVINPADWWLERHIMARRFIEQKRYRDAYDLASGHKQVEGLPFAQAEFLAGWLALRFLNDPKRAHHHFEALYNNVKTPISKARGAYWAGKAAEALGDHKVAQASYAIAGKFQTTFYGQMGGAELGMAQALEYAAPPTLGPMEIEQFNGDDLIRAVRLFHAAGMRAEVGRFLKAFVRAKKTPQAYVFAAELALEIGHRHDAVRLAKEATKEGLFLTAWSFPIIPDELDRVSVDWALVHAIIRQESMFDVDARSPAGAQGLMQLMPGTASDTARDLGVRHHASWLTSKPSHNILLGSRYLQKMLTRYGGSYPMAIAAYNAGPRRVDEWLKVYGDPRLGQVDLIDWIEMIPIYETRNYVQRVMEGVYVYRLRLRKLGKESPEPVHIAAATRYR